MQTVQNTTRRAAQKDEFELDVRVTKLDTQPNPGHGGHTATATQAPMRPPTHTTITGDH